jgi:anti-anti-sigma factor
MTRLTGVDPNTQAPDPDAAEPLVHAAFDAFELTITKQATVTTIRLAGELDMAHADDLTVLAEVAFRDTSELRLDLTALTFLDSCGLGALVRLRTHADTSGIGMSVRGASDRISRLFRMTGLDDLFVTA